MRTLSVRMMVKRRLSLLAMLTAAAGCTNGQGATGAKVSRQSLAGSERLPNWGETELAATSPLTFEHYNSVAIAGRLSLVGIKLGSDDTFSGTVIPYHQTGKDWVQETPLVSDDPDQTTGFSWAVAVSSTDAVASGVLRNSGNGAVWPFTRTADAWIPSGLAITAPPDAQAQSAFGAALALQGDTLVVGSVFADGSDPVGAVVAQGAAYVYARKPQGWELEETLKPTGAATAGSSFGRAVAIAGDFVAVGAPDELGSDGNADGAVYVFQRSSQTGVWGTGQRFVAAMPSSSAYGESVALSVTHATSSAAFITRLAVGAPDGDDESGGRAYVYELSANGWSSEIALIDPDGVGGGFGTVVGFSSDKLFVSATSANTGNTGHVQAFDLGAALAPLGNLVLESQPDDAQTTIGVTMAISPSSSLILSAAPGVYVFAPTAGHCDTGATCATGYCSDGVCCDTACTGTCQSCLAANKKDQKNEGTCGLVAADIDPRDDCKAGSGICGMTGVCDGAGSCALRAKDVACDDARCSTRTALVGGSICDGKGHCAAPEAQACDAGLVCEGGACAATCIDDTACDTAHGFYCFNEACVTGPRCSADRLSAYSASGVISDCSPSFCKEGACLTGCTTNSNCQAGHACQNGVCTTTCSATPDCDTANGYYCFERFCVTGARCSGSTLYGATGDDTSCGPFLCKNDACLLRCSTSDDCTASSVCNQSSNCVDIGQGSGSHISSSSCSIGFSRRSRLGWLFTLGFATWLAARRRNIGKSRSRRLTE